MRMLLLSRIKKFKIQILFKILLFFSFFNLKIVIKRTIIKISIKAIIIKNKKIRVI